MVTRESLVYAVARQSDCTIQEARGSVESVLEALRQGLITDGGLELRGLFTARVKRSKSYRGRNPKTGTAVEVPARMTVKFKISTLLKKAL